MGFIVSIIAYILFLPMVIINFITVTIKNAKKQSYLKTMNEYWFENGYEIDVFANYHFRTTWNLWFRKKGGYDFGVVGETISSALGKNQLQGTLTIGGWIIVYILFIIDYKNWFNGGHCLASIQN